MGLNKEAREYFAKEGQKGGKATAKKRTPQERSAAARKAVKARWAKADSLIKEMRAAEKEVFKTKKKATPK